MGLPNGIAAPSCARPELERERILADALIDVASELRLTDVAELINLIRNDESANLADLVNSSTELFYKRGTMRSRSSGAPARRLGGEPMTFGRPIPPSSAG